MTPYDVTWPVLPSSLDAPAFQAMEILALGIMFGTREPVPSEYSETVADALGSVCWCWLSAERRQMPSWHGWGSLPHSQPERSPIHPTIC